VPHAQTLRVTPLATRGNVSFFGCLGYELDLKHLLQVELKQIREQTDFYKQYRHVFQFGRFRRWKNTWQVSDGVTTIVGVFHGLTRSAPGYDRVRVFGLDKDKLYRVQSRAQAIRVGQFGNLLKHVAPVDIDPNGALLRMVDRRFTLPDGEEDYTVSGAALESGITLMPRFRGTGYDKRQHTHADFGSDVYVIREAEEGTCDE